MEVPVFVDGGLGVLVFLSSSTAAATRSARNVIYRGVVTEGVEVTSKESHAKKT